MASTKVRVINLARKNPNEDFGLLVKEEPRINVKGDETSDIIYKPSNNLFKNVIVRNLTEGVHFIKKAQDGYIEYVIYSTPDNTPSLYTDINKSGEEYSKDAHEQLKTLKLKYNKILAENKKLTKDAEGRMYEREAERKEILRSRSPFNQEYRRRDPLSGLEGDEFD